MGEMLVNNTVSSDTANVKRQRRNLERSNVKLKMWKVKC